MADTPSVAEQMQQNLADLTAQNQSILANIQHSNAVGAANEAASMAQTDAFISALETGAGPGVAPPGFEGQGPHVEGIAPPMADGQPMSIIDGQTQGLQVSQSLHHGDGDDVVESLLGFDLDGDDSDGDGQFVQVDNLQDAVQLAHETGGVVVIEEVIVIDPSGQPVDTNDHHGGDFTS